MELIRRLLTYFVEDGGRLFSEKVGVGITVEELFGLLIEEPEEDGPLTEEQQESVNRLTAEEIQKIDGALLANASTQWRKVAGVVGGAMTANSGIISQIPDIFYAERVRELVAAGKLESQGNLEFMRYSEVRLRAER